MNPQEINKRIAIVCGWKLVFQGRYDKPEWEWESPIEDDESDPPNYHGDLNAMHEVEKGMENQQWWKFVYHLTDICGGGAALGISATAAQRAEAFLRTLGQWEEAE
jgi:hypothetical protein